MRNSILWNNTSPSGTAIEVQNGPLDIAWCDVQGGQASVTLGASGTLIWGPGNALLAVRALQEAGCHPHLAPDQRMEILKALAPRLSQTAVLHAIGCSKQRSRSSPRATASCCRSS